MDYFIVKRLAKDGRRLIRVAIEPQGFGESYEDLHEATDICFYDMLLAEISKGLNGSFDNAFARAMEACYEQRTVKGKTATTTPFGLITRDLIVGTGAEPYANGGLAANVIVYPGLPHEERHDGLLLPPSNAYWVPVSSRLEEAFYPGTPVAKRTVPTRDEAVDVWVSHGFPRALAVKYVSKLWRPAKLKADEKRFAGRLFGPYWGDDGRFSVRLDGLPSLSGSHWVASLPAYKETKIVGEVEEIPQEAVQKE